ncbi:MAG: LON peptidase substrate-binding domain-containing protein, partial [Bdellovibrionales bacterium]|nr:LON peptidase substrate-binding domain-containing protein [Bdellovibrionales bacterium]
MDDKSLQIPDQIPMLPVRDIVIFPYMIIPLFVGRESSIQAVEDSLAKNRLIFLSSQMDLTEETPTENSIYKVGTVAMIMRMRKLADGRVKILIQGMTKARITQFHQNQPFFNVSVEKVNEETVLKAEALIRTAKELLEKVIALGKVLSPDILLVLDDIKEPGRVADLIASNLGLKVDDAQKILETVDHLERLKAVNEILTSEVEVLQMQAEIRTTAKDEMSKSQREYFLREQMKAIKAELGEQDS